MVRLRDEADTTLKIPKKTQNRTKNFNFVSKDFIRKSLKWLAKYRYQLLSSFLSHPFPTEIFNFQTIGIQQQKKQQIRGKHMNLCGILKENGVATLSKL